MVDVRVRQMQASIEAASNGRRLLRSYVAALALYNTVSNERLPSIVSKCIEPVTVRAAPRIGSP
jgi:hypothetical protein